MLKLVSFHIQAHLNSFLQILEYFSQIRLGPLARESPCIIIGRITWEIDCKIRENAGKVWQIWLVARPSRLTQVSSQQSSIHICDSKGINTIFKNFLSISQTTQRITVTNNNRTMLFSFIWPYETRVHIACAKRADSKHQRT